MKISQLWNHNHNFSFELGSRKVEFCSRCSGIVLGFTAWITTIFLFSGLELLVYDRSPLQILALCFILTLPLVIFWLVQSSGRYHNNNGQRFLSGLLLAAGLALFVVRRDLILITLPFALLWQGLVLAIGYKFRNSRKTDWECKSCHQASSLF